MLIHCRRIRSESCNKPAHKIPHDVINAFLQAPVVIMSYLIGNCGASLFCGISEKWSDGEIQNRLI